MKTTLTESQWRGFSLPAELRHVSTKHPNPFALYSEIRDVEDYLKSNDRRLAELKIAVGDADEKSLERFASKLKYNGYIFLKNGGELLGKRDETDSESLMRFYQECGIDTQGREFERRSATPGGKEEWPEDKNKRKDQMRKFDPRIRGMMRLVEQFGGQADFVKLSYSLLGDTYKDKLFEVAEDAQNKKFTIHNLPTEEAIEKQASELLKSKKIQERVFKMIEKLNKSTIEETEIELLTDNLEHILNNIISKTAPN